ncbi:hypothetical protein HDK90DRAFT_511178 [Phyllosticta capitalensis]|uniref:Uncharacterized protein n=1 Tax=Phyllosticta capitalensis TaxID=121624 RepID=A0ABR1YLE6_9PEZI
MTLKFSSKFRHGRGGRSHRFDKLEDANASESACAAAAAPPLDSFNATANLPPATTPDPHDSRSRAASRTSAARRSVAGYQNLTFSDVQQLTNVLSHAPSPAISWQSPMWATYARFTRQQIEELPAHLRCKSNSPFSSRFWMSGASKSSNQDSSDGCLCKLHSQLNVDLVRSIFAFLQREIEDHIPAILDPLSDAGRLTRQHEEVMNALSTVPALWAAASSCPERTQQETAAAAATASGADGPFRDIRRRLGGRRDSMISPNGSGGTPRMYSVASSLQSTLSLSTSASMSKLLSMSTNTAAAPPTAQQQQFHRRSCLACAVAQIGSSPAIIFALRVGILARSQTEPNRRGVRITFVECWMEHLYSASEDGADRVARVMRESFELGMQLRGLYRRLSIERERLRIDDSEDPVDMTIREWNDNKAASRKGAAAAPTSTTTTGFWVDLGHKANHAWPFKTRGRGSNLSMFDLARSHSTTQKQQQRGPPPNKTAAPRTRNSNYSMFDLARSHSTTANNNNNNNGPSLSKHSSTSRLRAIRAYSSSHLKPRPKTSYTLASRSRSVSSHHQGRDGEGEGEGDRLLHAIRPKTSFFHGSVSLTPRPSLRSLSRRKSSHHTLKPRDSAAAATLLVCPPSPPRGATTTSPGPAVMGESDHRSSKATQTSPHMSASYSHPVTVPSSSSIPKPTFGNKPAAATASHIEKLLPPLPPQHRARKRRHLSLPDALTTMAASPSSSSHHHHHHQQQPQQYHYKHTHPHRRLHRQRGVANLLADGADDAFTHPQMHVHPALRTSRTMVFCIDSASHGGLGAVDGGVREREGAGERKGGSRGVPVVAAVSPPTPPPKSASATTSTMSTLQGGSNGSSKPDANLGLNLNLSLFPRTTSLQRTNTNNHAHSQKQRPRQHVPHQQTGGGGGVVGKGEEEGEAVNDKQKENQNENEAWGCALMKEMGI